MRTSSKIFGFIALLICSMAANAQNLSNKGKEFWVGYGHHQFFETGANSQEMLIYLSAEQPATVTVSINGTAYSQTYNIPANTVIATSPIPKSGTYDCRLFSGVAGFTGTNSEGISDRGIHIQSNVPIVAYAHIYGSSSSGSTMLMPVETYGYSYVTLGSMQNYQSNCFSWINVIAKENNTKVQIVPAVPTRGGLAAGQLLTIVMNKGQVYQILGANQSGSVGYDLTGTTVKSVANANGECFPIAVFSGSSRTYITCSGGSGGGGDNQLQQAFPFQAWGKKYLTAPTSNGNLAYSLMTNVYRVAVKDPTTVVKRNGVQLTGLVNNFYYEFSSGTADFIEADKPIMVLQMMVSNGGCPNVGTSVGDPGWMYISPIEQAIKKVGFYRNTLQAITVNYLTLVIPTLGVASLTIDGSSTFDYTYAHPNYPGYTVVVKRWTAAQAQCQVQSDSAFTAVTYGEGSVESYGYNAGTLINNLNVLPGLHNSLDNTTTSHPFTCKNTPAEISMYVAYKPTNMVWKMSQLPTASPNLDVTDNNPTPIDSILQNGVWYYKYRLPGTYSFSDTGTIQIPVKNTHPSIDNCNNSEVVTFGIIVRPNPVANFTFTHTGCMRDSVYFNSPSSTSNNFVANNWQWNFDDGTTLTGANPIKIFSSPGAQNIHLRIVSSEGCVGDTIRSINIYPPPSATFGNTPTNLCVGGSVSFTDTSSYQGSSPINGYYWDFGTGTPVSINTNTPQTVTFPGYGTYTVKHVVRVSATCVSDTFSRVITVFAKPNINIDFPAGCLPANGIVQFNNNSATPDNQTMTHTWDFGDPAATPSNPNTSTLYSPSHSFGYGAYTIHYTATSVNGCYKDTTIQTTFNVSPSVSFTPLTAVCESVTGTVSVANGSVINNVAGTGVYKGPATTAAGLFNPSQAGPGTHTIWYVFTSAGGCKDSLSQTILVYAKPHPTFTFPSGCLSNTGLVQFTGNATIADAQTMTYLWNFNDPNANTGNPNSSTLLSPSHNFGTGTYNIKLTATSANGCVTDTTASVTFSVTPQVNYPALSSVCENQSTLSIATGVVTNNVTGTGVYSGPGTTAAGLFTPSVAGPGTHTIWYVFTSAGGCKDSMSQTIKVYARPRPSFTFPAGCLPNTGLVQFTGSATIADGQSMTYLWDFNDPNANTGNPNSSTLLSPTHNYTNTGTYTIKLTATSANGCTYDTSRSVTFSVTPLVAYPYLASVCENQPAFSIATGTVNNSVTGTGTYSGPGVTSAGMFTPATAGAGMHTITYVYTSSAGCIDSAKRQIKVFPKPVAAFTVNSSICADQVATLTNSSTISTGNITGWNWNFGDNTTANNTNGNSFTHSYSNWGNYTVTLVAKSDSNCASDPVTKTIAVNPLPVAKFTLPASICMPGGVGTFTNTSTVANNGNMSYVWDFGDATATSNATSPTHTYAAAGNYAVKLTVSSGGCSKDTTITLPASVFSAKPVANFTVAPDVLCQGANNVFTDLSTPAGSIQSWDWDYGDGTSHGTTASPTKKYTSPGNFQVSLTVKNTAGCTSDPFVKPVLVYLQPKIDAGPNFVVPEGTQITFNPTVNSTSGVSFVWTPSADFANPTVLRPSIIATHNQTYTVTATGQGNCTASDTMSVKILKPVTVPNSFSPNGDGVNDKWVITNLADYPGAIVEVYNRYGQLVFKANGYSTPWDGTFKGSPIPFATYYYVITLKNGFQPITGSVTIVR